MLSRLTGRSKADKELHSMVQFSSVKKMEGLSGWINSAIMTAKENTKALHMLTEPQVQTKKQDSNIKNFQPRILSSMDFLSPVHI